MTKINRRNFLRSSGALTAGALILPNFISCSANSTVNVAVVGVSGRGFANWTQMLGILPDHRRVRAGLEEEGQRPPHPHVKIVAMCDVDDDAAALSYKTLPQARKFKDFRVMMDEMHKDIDAVIVSTPDHMHFAATMAAMELGKHVYVEKPLAHDVWQLRTLKKAAKYYDVVTQLGNQGHASGGIRSVKEWYDQGLVGDVREVHAWFNGPKFGPKGWFMKPEQYPPVKQPVRESLDWDLWLGAAKKRPYSPYYLPRFWRSYYDLGTGMLGDWGCHTLDAPYWTLDLGFPDVIEPIHAKLSPTPTEFVTDESVLRYEFPQRGNKPPVTLTWYEGGKKPENRPEYGLKRLGGNGMIMIGENQTVLTDGKPYDPKMLMPKEEWDAFNKKGWEKTIPRIPNESPHAEFIAAIRGNGPKPGSSFEYGADLTEIALLGALSQRFNTRIEYDAENMRIKNHPELNKYLKEEVRSGWSYGEDLWK